MASALANFLYAVRAVGFLLAAVRYKLTSSEFAPVQICAEKILNNESQYLDGCGTRWAIMNKATVIEYWQVMELRFYWDASCSVGLPVTSSFESSVMSTMQLDTSDKVFDGIETTRWTANCRFLLGGCLPKQEYVGLDSSGFNSVNFNPNSHYANVRCVKLYQSKNVTLQATEIYVITWLNQTDYHIVSEYHTLTGGVWLKRPASENQLWRIWNYKPTERPWKVAEFMLYSDTFCTSQERGIVISSLPYHSATCVDQVNCDEYKADYMVDGIQRPGQPLPDALPTYWMANCDWWTGCPAEAAWFGLDFGEAPKTIRCMRIYQPAYDGYPGFGFPTYTEELRMQSWDGYKWVETSLITKLGQGAWNDTVPAYKSAWRLSNYDKMDNKWMVFEMGLYEDMECAKKGAEVVTGLPISSNPERTFAVQEAICQQQFGSCPGLAFDNILDTAWESECDQCDQRDAWLGVYFRGTDAREIKCFKLLQSLELQHQTAVVELSYWTGSGWEVARVEAEIGGGTWNFRPAAIGSMFRVLSNTVTVEPWTLTGFQMYDDVDCLTVTDAMHLVSGSSVLNSVDGAFDDDPSTYWEASCPAPFPGSNGCALNSAWLGAQAYGIPMDVRCIRIQQHRLRERQVSSVRLQEWQGIQWITSSRFPQPIFEMGGGAWQMLPGSLGSMWRVAATPTGLGFGVSELEFYRSGDCTAGRVRLAPPNFMPICSAFSTGREVSSATGFSNHLRVIGDFADTGPDLAFDGKPGSFWADLTNQLSWVGLDSTTQPMDVLCVRISLAGAFSLQASQAEVQAWTGVHWATVHSANTAWTRALPFAVPFPSGSGVQQRPTPDRSMWRLQNDEVISGWEVMEVRMYKFVDCSGPSLAGPISEQASHVPAHLVTSLSGKAISSLPVTTEATENGGHTMGANVYDGSTVTRWSADCRGQTCAPGTAWIGVDSGISTVTSCFRIIQSGRRELQSRKIALAVWLNERWTIVEHYNGFGGETWNQRPSAPDTLWRISLATQKTDLCAGHTRNDYMRSWGVSELEFYSDDKCSQKLPGLASGARVLVSGTREPNIAIQTAKSQYDPTYAFDGRTSTFWAAQCGNQKDSDAAFCSAGYEWIGMDYSGVPGGGPQDVRCFKIHQNRASRRECCDPASEIKLERWNGTDWAMSAWRHVSLNRDSIITGTFDRMGKCPSIVEQVTSSDNDYWETRKRRQSEQCIVPLAASVKLLSDPLCDKHSECAEAGFGGKCCPYVAQTAESRCCCDFLTNNEVFEDEMEKDANRKIRGSAPVFGFEYIVIRSVIVLPFVGLAVSIIVFILANTPQPRGCLMRPWAAMCGPLQRWLASTSPVARALAWFVIRNPKEKLYIYRLKILLWFALGFVGGGCSVYLLISYLIAELFILVTVIISLTIRLAKSPYKPGDPADKKRMMIILALPFDGGSPLFGDNPLGQVASQFAATIVMSLAYAFRAVFDFIIMRFALMNLGMVDVEISIKDILTAMPDFGVDITPVLDVMYEVIAQSSKIFMEAFVWLFEGVPQCEGPVILISGMWIVSVTMVLVRWLNYDMFGVFTASKNIVTQTRPMFQKACGTGTMLGVQAGMFLFMQCVMLLFARSLTLVNPFDDSNQQWMCPYEGDAMSIIVGRILLTTAAFVAVGLTFLCANGHFMGQDYIVREYSKWIDMNLSGLDPDGIGDSGGFVKFDSFLSMIPTTFGIWIDGWNVHGYMIKQRAEIYAEELNLPLECPYCECAHVPYNEIMRATGMQLSLAYQLMPMGIVVAKACEYLNNPPLIYWGKELKCFHSHRYMRHVLDGMPKKTNTCGQLKIWGALIVAAFYDLALPLLARLAGLGMYVLVIYLTFSVDKENVATMVKDGFTAVVAVAGSKAFCEFLVPAVILVVLMLVMFLVFGRDRTVALEKDKRNVIPVVGAVWNGLAGGISLALYLLEKVDGTEKGFAALLANDGVIALLGMLVGLGTTFASLLLGLALEWLHHSRVIASGVLFIYLVGGTLGFGFLATNEMPARERLIISVSASLLLVAVTSYSFWPPEIGRGGPNSVKVRHASVLPLFKTARILSAPIGVCAGVFTVTKLHTTCIKGFGEYWGLAVVVLAGLIVGLIYACATDSVIERPSAQVALSVGTFIALMISLFWLWYIGLLVGSVVGCILGAIIEEFTMRAVMAETVLMQPGDAAELKQTQRLDGTVGPGRGPREGLDFSFALVDAAPKQGEIKALIDNGPDGTKDLKPSPLNDIPEDNDAITASTLKTNNRQTWARRTLTPQITPQVATVVQSTESQAQPRALLDYPTSPTVGKRFGLKTGADSPSATMQNWQGSHSPAETAVAFGWVGAGVGNKGQYVRQSTQASNRSLSSPASTGALDKWNLQMGRGSTSSGPGSRQAFARGTAKGGLPITPGSSRQIASIVRATPLS